LLPSAPPMPCSQEATRPADLQPLDTILQQWDPTSACGARIAKPIEWPDFRPLADDGVLDDLYGEGGLDELVTGAGDNDPEAGEIVAIL